MRQLFKENIYFLVPYLFFVFVSSGLMFIFSKAEIHLYINSYHHTYFDFFFKYWTHIGHGFFALFIIVILLFIKYRWAIITVISTVLTGIIVQLLKRQVFPDSYRPVFWFKHFYEKDYSLYLVEGAEPGALFAFPSGHTATAFGIFFLLSIFTKNKYIKLSFFLFALLAAYSRMYLSWHFLQDTLLGSIIGLIISLFVYLLFLRNKTNRLDGSLLKKLKKSDK